MSKSFRKDLTGQRFGRLTVIGFYPTNSNMSYWTCQCKCGKISVCRRDHLIQGEIQSCRCLQKEIASDRLIKINKKNKKHDFASLPIYNIWKSMKQRCYNLNSQQYKDYGGRGITICDEWKDDAGSFIKWAFSNGYQEGLSIDRIDNDKGYYPENCRWVDRKTQNRNMRRNIIVMYNGKEMCLKDVSAQLGIKYTTLIRRYHYGDRGKRLFRPVK